MIKHDIDANEIIKYLGLIDNISAVNAGMIEKSRSQYLFRGESKCHDKKILPKYSRPLKGKGVSAESSYLENELDIISQFRDEAYPYIQNVDKNDFRTWREYAQHYGVPTKLLDWSSNPLVALFFACSDSYDDDGIVWMINWGNYHGLTNQVDVDGKSLAKMTVSDMVDMAAQGNPRLENPVIYKPCYTDLRMSAQGSHFMLWGTSGDDLIKQIGDRYVKEANYLSQKIAEGGTIQIKDSIVLYYFIIDKDQKKKNLLRLSRLGISFKTLFPSLDGVGKYIDEINKYTEQEFIDYFYGDL